MRLAFIFDLDGVIFDSIPQLFSAYINFMKKFHLNGTKEEFDFLSAKALDEIVSYLKDTYNLSKSKKILLDEYESHITNAVQQGKLTLGIRELLNKLSKEQYPLFLVTQAHYKYVNRILNKHQMSNLFVKIITGNEQGVKCQKYLSIKKEYKDLVFYVIEDSDSGMQSAIDAGYKVCFYNPLKRKSTIDYNKMIKSFGEFYTMIEEVKEESFFIETASDVLCKIVNAPIKISDMEQGKINEFWEKEKTKNQTLFDSNILCYDSHYYNKKGVLVINSFWFSYKNFYYQHCNKSMGTFIYPLGVSGIIVDSNNNVVIGKRIKTTQYNGRYELVPSGSINYMSNWSGNSIARTQFIKEYIEEAQGKVEDIKNIKYIGLLYDYKDRVYDICMRLNLATKLQRKSSQVQEEYKDISVVCAKKLLENQELLIPTSKEILKHARLL